MPPHAACSLQDAMSDVYGHVPRAEPPISAVADVAEASNLVLLCHEDGVERCADGVYDDKHDGDERKEEASCVGGRRRAGWGIAALLWAVPLNTYWVRRARRRRPRGYCPVTPHPFPQKNAQ